MSRAAIILNTPADRTRAATWVHKAPPGTSVMFKVTKRTLDQNAKLWAGLTDIAQQVEWYGQHLSADDWKDVLTASLRRVRVVPGIDAGTFVPLGMRTSDMTKDEFSQLLELMLAFGTEHGVQFHEPAEQAA